MSDLISRSALIKAMNESKKQPTSDENTEGYCEGWNDLADIINEQPTAYSVEKVVEEVKKLDLDGVSMVEDGKYKLVRKNEVVSLIQTNGVCNGRHTTCADCYKKDCTLSTEKTLTDKWSEEVRKGGIDGENI